MAWITAMPQSNKTFRFSLLEEDYWKEKIKTPSWICSAPSARPETIKMLPGSQLRAECCQMKMSTGAAFSF